MIDEGGTKGCCWMLLATPPVASVWLGQVAKAERTVIEQLYVTVSADDGPQSSLLCPNIVDEPRNRSGHARGHNNTCVVCMCVEASQPSFRIAVSTS